ncbi:hypothetical protein SAMN04488518_108255 [Pseudovibrio ascidiaceicola]|uniref:DUF4251 domain-containing protein n=1 Tax=Pseudovibrio ascidiaceicola TaxID=285279 RepID=A0A1I4BYZ4_9HYPH|nr:hypothetical protein [Pseudovibrio ascidiaceicola]SFK74014.1 hypothetical protein SAMN04488518_108255 [Pseudovibrio ascidiaceicola]
MHLPKLKKSGVALLLTLGMLGPASSQIINRDNRANPFTDMKRVSPSRQVSIQSLTVQTDAVGLEVCTERYGDGYILYPTPSGGQKQFVSDKGHTLTIYARSELREESIYAEHSQMLITFSNDPDVEVEVTVFITGFVNSRLFSGVFSDGTCAGHFSITDTK